MLMRGGGAARAEAEDVLHGEGDGDSDSDREGEGERLGRVLRRSLSLNPNLVAAGMSLSPFSA
jgi:hypothetical protein